MANIHTMIPSSFLKKEDFPSPALVTITRLYQDNVAPQGQPQEMKWVMQFGEYDRGLVLNSTNIQLAAQALGSDESDDWVGKKIVVYNDPNVSYAGKITGGLRLRKPKNQPAKAPSRQAQPVSDTGFDNMDDDIPF